MPLAALLKEYMNNLMNMITMDDAGVLSHSSDLSILSSCKNVGAIDADLDRINRSNVVSTRNTFVNPSASSRTRRKKREILFRSSTLMKKGALLSLLIFKYSSELYVCRHMEILSEFIVRSPERLAADICCCRFQYTT